MRNACKNCINNYCFGSILPCKNTWIIQSLFQESLEIFFREYKRLMRSTYSVFCIFSVILTGFFVPSSNFSLCDMQHVSMFKTKALKFSCEEKCAQTKETIVSVIKIHAAYDSWSRKGFLMIFGAVGKRIYEFHFAPAKIIVRQIGILRLSACKVARIEYWRRGDMKSKALFRKNLVPTITLFWGWLNLFLLLPFFCGAFFKRTTLVLF